MIPVLTGQDEQEAAVLSALASGRMPHAWLLAGPQGLGKAAFARRAGLFLLADGDRRAAAGAASLSIPDDDPVLALVEAGAHPEFLWLTRELPKSRREKGEDSRTAKEEDLARNVTIDQVRDLLGKMRVKPAMACWRAVIVDSIDDLERGAANALLKTLEEPPANTVFFLVSHMPGRLLPTIRSRCRLLRFAPLEADAMAALLGEALPGCQPEDIAELVRVGQGSPGRALSFGRLGLAEIARALEMIAATGDRDNRHRSELARKLATAAEKPRFEAMLLQASALVAARARTSSGHALAAALSARERIGIVARHAVSGSEDPATVTFAVAGALASLATGANATGAWR